MDFSQKIIFCTDEILQDFIKKVDSSELVHLMTYVFNEEANECIFRNMSERAKDMLKEDIGYFKDTKKKLECFLDESIQSFPENTTEKAVLFTDLVNSTAKINLLGDNDYYENVLLKHNTILSDSIRNNSGRIIKTIGDAYLAIFITNFNALKACIEAQKKIKETNMNRNVDNQIFVRMALHYGKFSLKVIENGSVDVYGSEINYAARIVGVTGGNRIFVSKKYFDEWQKWMDVDTLKTRLKEDEERLENKKNELNNEYNELNNLKNRIKIYKENIELMEKIKFSSAGFFSFKGFENEQELFTVNLEELI